MNFGSVCSGIEAASVAWEPLGWKAQFFSEIEAFPRAVLAHHYPRVVNHGDMTKFKGWPDHAIDLLVGGTPCQSFSIAGLRAGLADPRGDLMLTYLAIAAKYRPRWLAWENVPGVLSSGGGRDFGTFLGGLVELGYGYAYRVLDAQFCRTFGFPFAVPQRRRRVFVIGYLGDWRPAAAVLFDAACLRGDHPPRRETGQRTSGTLAARAGGGGRPDGGDGRHDQLIATSGTIDAAQGRARGAGINPGQIIGVPDIVSQAMTAKWSKGSSGPAGDEVVNLIPIVPPLRGGDGGGSHGPGTDNDTVDSLVVSVAPTLRAGGNQTGGDRPPGSDVDTADSLIPISFKPSHFTRGKDGAPASVASPLSADADKGDQDQVVLAPIAFPEYMSGTQSATTEDLSPSLGATNPTAIAFDTTQITSKAKRSNPQPGDPSHPLTANGDVPSIAFGFEQRTRGDDGRGYDRPPHFNKDLSPTVNSTKTPSVAFPLDLRNAGRDPEKHDEQNRQGAGVGEDGDPAPTLSGAFIPGVATSWAVRRLTVVECERLQGYQDGYTDVPYRKRNWTPDGPRYKALGNSMATNVMRVIGERIDMVERLISK